MAWIRRNDVHRRVWRLVAAAVVFAMTLGLTLAGEANATVVDTDDPAAFDSFLVE